MLGSGRTPWARMQCICTLLDRFVSRLPISRFFIRRLFVSLLAVVILVLMPARNSWGQVSTTGQWQTLPTQMPINPVHVALMHNGKVLIVSGSGNLPSDTNYMAGVWDPATDTVSTQPVQWDMFCNGMIVLPDGRPFILGGTLQYDPFFGQPRTSAFDPVTGSFVDLEPMNQGRWYPTATTLADGSVMVFSGLGETGATNTAVEIYKLGSGWSQQFVASWTPPLYPRMHLLPNGNVFYSGSTTSSAIFSTSSHSWTTGVANTLYSGTRTYGTSVLFPLTPANGYKPMVMIMGGGSPSTNTTEFIDLSVSSPKWAHGPPMSQPRIEMNATILPNGKFLVTGGSLNDEDGSTASLNADLYDPVANTFSLAGANAYARLYHSNSLLLPDATVLLLGSNPARGTYEPHMEIYTPAYLFNSDGTLSTRPAITSVTPGVIGYGTSLTVQTPDASSISSVVLIRPGAVTHSFDMDQRLVGLSFTRGSGVLNVTGPPNGNIAPPGYYLLFILNSSGVPSVAKFVQVSPTPADQPPTGIITNPSTDQQVGIGQAVSFSGSGTDPDGTISAYEWVFPGGSPSSSTLANPGNVIYSTAGSYVASLTVTDNAGLTDPRPPTRTVTVGSLFSLAATPTTQTVAAGASTSFLVTVTPVTGFNGNVSFTTAKLPSGVTATFTPSSVTTSGSTTMNVTTSSSTPSGTYSLTINGTSGSFISSTTVTVAVTAGISTKSITFVQGNYATPHNQGTAPVTATFTAAQTAGDLNVVMIGWNDTTSTVKSVTDTVGNSYAVAAVPTLLSGNATHVIYYAKNIGAAVANGNTVTVNFNGSAIAPDVRILEYAGADTSSPLDTSAGATGTSTTSTVTVTTANVNDLIIAGNYVEQVTTGPGAGFTSRMITQPDGDIAEDRLVMASGSYTATAPLNPSGWWAMQAAAFLPSVVGPPDTQPPTAPANLAATSTSSSQISLSWTASTDNVGVTGYKVERCQGAGCATFAQIATPAGITFNDTGLTASTSYSYRVRATDAAGNLSTYSNTSSATTSTAPPPPTNVTFVQGNYATPHNQGTAPVTATFTAAQTAGDLNVVMIGWNDTTSTVKSVTDTVGNSYAVAAVPTLLSGNATHVIYYAKNIGAAVANGNTVTVNFNGSAIAPDVRILEYAGASLTNPLDAAAGATGTSTTSTVTLTTSSVNDLIVAGNYVEQLTTSPGAGFTSRMITQPDGDIAEDKLTTTAASYAATASVTPSGWWVMQVIAIRHN
jgi:hypothetical protein